MHSYAVAPSAKFGSDAILNNGVALKPVFHSIWFTIEKFCVIPFRSKEIEFIDIADTIFCSNI